MNCTVERGIKDRQHPFAQISRNLINDDTISSDLRFLIIFCLSKPDSWKFHIEHLAKSLKQSIKSIYRILQEGTAHGYIVRDQRRDQANRFLPVVYKIYEEKSQNKEKFTQGAFRKAECRHTENDTISNSNSLVTNKQEEAPPVVVVPSLSKLKISEPIKRRLSTQYDASEIDVAVDRVLKWKGRESDEKAIITALKRASIWEDEVCEKVVSGPKFKDKIESAKEHLQEFSTLCPDTLKYVWFYTEDVIVKIGEKQYLLTLSDALFEDKFKNCIRILYEEIARTS